MQHPSENGLFNDNMTDHMLHFWRSGVNSRAVMAGENYKCVPPLPSEFALKTNVMTIVSAFQYSVTVLEGEDNVSGKQRKMHPEHKPVA